MRSLTVIASAAVALFLSTDTALAQHEHMKSQEQVLTIGVTSKGFVPAKLQVMAGHPVKLVVTCKTDQTCAKDIVVKDFGVSKPLPLNQPVEITFTPKKSGQIGYTCAADMIAGVIIVD